MKKIPRNTDVIVKDGSLVKSWDVTLGDREVGKNYRVKIVDHYISKTENTVHWVGRHGHYCYTDIKNVTVC